ncbi:MAG: hypothetical protein WCK34_04020 [Bacteroidota bacterium]
MEKKLKQPGAATVSKPDMNHPDDSKQFSINEIKWFELVMEEYRAIKQEIAITLTNMQTVLNFGLATIGVLILAAATIISQIEITGIIFLFVVPIVSYFIVIIWIGELERITRAGFVIRSIEKKVNKFFSDEALIWEGWMRGVYDKKKKSKWLSSNYTSIIFLFNLISILSIAIGFFQVHGIMYRANFIILILIELIINILFTVFLLRKRFKMSEYKKEVDDENN